jgi:hypothetical protein
MLPAPQPFVLAVFLATLALYLAKLAPLGFLLSDLTTPNMGPDNMRAEGNGDVFKRPAPVKSTCSISCANRGWGVASCFLKVPHRSALHAFDEIILAEREELSATGFCHCLGKITVGWSIPRVLMCRVCAGPFRDTPYKAASCMQIFHCCCSAVDSRR